MPDRILACRQRSTERGFTLVELLIVVAILAILSAIAAPNFQEAQTRAKVARCKADFSAIAAGLETYRVDNHEYPYSSGIHAATGAIERQNSQMNSAHKFLSPALTTPIAYMTKVPADPFATNYETPEERQYFYSCLSVEKTRGLRPAWPGPGNAFENRLRFLGDWTMWGCGPDLDRTDISPAKIGGPASIQWCRGYYDPTNGTISNGDIFRSQKHAYLGF